MTASAAPETTAGEESEKDDLLRRFTAWFNEARTHSSDWRTESEESDGFEAGDGGQWDEDQKDALAKQNRPVVEFNRVYATVASVLGLEIGNRQEVRVVPRETGDSSVAEVCTRTVDWQRDGCDAENEESAAFHDMLRGGMGWTETRMDMERNPNGLTVTERFNAREAYWDPASQKKNLADSKWRMRARDMTFEDAQAEFPDADAGDLHAGWASEAGDEKTETDVRDYPDDPDNNQLDPKRTCRIVQVQWWERIGFYRALDPMTGEQTELSAEQMASLKSKGIEMRAVKATRKVYKQAFVGAKVLEVGPGPCKYDFTLQCMTGIRDHKRGVWYGIIRHMKDPQRYANKFFSQIMYIINANAKGGILIEQGAMANPRKFEEEWAKPDSVSVLQDGALKNQQIQYKPAITYPSGLDKMMDYSIQSIRDTSGVNLELLGMADRSQAGVLESQRKKSALTILATFFDALSQYRRTNGRTLVYFMKEYYPASRIERVVGIDPEVMQAVQMAQDPQVQQAAQAGEPQAQQIMQKAGTPDAKEMARLAEAIPKALEVDTIEYDVVVDEAPSSPNQKETVWATMLQAPQLLQNLPPPALLELMPLPQSVHDKLAMYVSPPPDPMVQEAKKLELHQKGADVQKTSGEARKVNAEAAEQEMQVAVGAKLLDRGGAEAMVKQNMDRANKQEQPRVQ